MKKCSGCGEYHETLCRCNDCHKRFCDKCMIEMPERLCTACIENYEELLKW